VRRGDAFAGMSLQSEAERQPSCVTCTLYTSLTRLSTRASKVLLQLFNTTAITMALLVDKHRPRSLDQLSYHKDLSERLRSLVRLLPSPKPTKLTITGTIRRLPSSLGLWTFRRRKKDPHRCKSKRTLRSRR
jgi:hypothetical protein